MSDWISVKDNLPEAMEMVLVHHHNFGVQVGFIDDNKIKPCRNRWIVYVRNNAEQSINHIPKTGKYEFVQVTHWMPLPPKPEEGK